MKLLEYMAKKFTKSASATAKKEVKKTIIDLIPGLLTVGSIIVGIVVFHEIESSDTLTNDSNLRPYNSTTHITTNNYFLGDVSEDIIKKVLEERE